MAVGLPERHRLALPLRGNSPLESFYSSTGMVVLLPPHMIFMLGLRLRLGIVCRFITVSRFARYRFVSQSEEYRKMGDRKMKMR
ncbi:hypothetical protein Rcae01_02239 [Novipirellula caenicola]|uniref:Transmembrane protein n=1 Tax=Novipirellula caenicola TaxID=1536901 RepID=A0ABP9VPS1_9BACT